MTKTITNELHTTIRVELDEEDIEQLIRDELEAPHDAYIDCSHAKASWTRVTELPEDFKL